VTGVAAEPVTVMVARRVSPGQEDDFEDWAASLTRAAAGFAGFLGAGLLRPGHVGEEWHVIYRFASLPDLVAWERSGTRTRLLAEADQLMQTTDVHRVSGLETWFELPGRTAPAPPKWKMFLVSVTGIYMLQLMFNVFLEVVAPTLWLSARVGLTSVAVTATMTWLVMPRLARLLAHWLYAPHRRGAG
jgi:antibiotic biosynthesis monooxygenase (ABM) superfamily enzyme